MTHYDEVIKLALQGRTAREIRALLPHIPYDSIKSYMSRARKNGVDIPYARQTKALRAPPLIPKELQHQLRHEAMRRDMTLAELVGLLLTIIVRDGLFEAALDDATTNGDD